MPYPIQPPVTPIPNGTGLSVRTALNSQIAQLADFNSKVTGLTYLRLDLETGFNVTLIDIPFTVGGFPDGYNTTTHVFTPYATGLYRIEVNIGVRLASDNTVLCQVLQNNNQTSWCGTTNGTPDTQYLSCSTSKVHSLTTSDAIRFVVNSNSSTFNSLIPNGCNVQITYLGSAKYSGV